jgi:hypothetical protein
MTPRWSPLKAALIVFGIFVLLGCVVAVVATSTTGTIHDQPYQRGQQIGTGVGVIAVLAGVAAYFIQQRRC